MSATLESVPFEPYSDVDAELTRVASSQLEARVIRDTRLQQLHWKKMGALPVGDIVQGGGDGRTINFGEVLPALLAPRKDTYGHVTFTEDSNPTLAREAWRIHSEGYFSSNFVTNEAIDPATGLLQDGIDNSRGPNVEYHIAFNPDPKRATDRATLRLDGLAPGGTYKDLPAYQLCKNSLSSYGRNLLNVLTDQGRPVKEVAAMAKTANGHPLGIHEIIRKVIQEAQGKDEAWLFTIVSTTFDSLTRSFGVNNFNVIGENVSIPDQRVNPEIRLTPTILFPDRFVDNILTSFIQSANPREQLPLARSLMFVSEGMRPEQLSEEARLMKKTLMTKAAHPPLETK